MRLRIYVLEKGSAYPAFAGLVGGTLNVRLTLSPGLPWPFPGKRADGAFAPKLRPAALCRRLTFVADFLLFKAELYCRDALY